VSGELWVPLPLLTLAGGAIGLYLLARLVPGIPNGLLASAAALIFSGGLAGLVPLSAASAPVWGALGPGGAYLRADPGALALAAVALGLGVAAAFYSGRYLALDRRYELYYPLLLLLAAGLVGMLFAADLFGMYLFCELMSVAAYALVAFRRRTDTAIEAGFKYLIMGSVGTIAMLMGIALIYRERGGVDIPAPAASALAGTSPGPWARAGLGCMLVGLAVKAAMVPVHTWLPDAHGRAPSSISAMLSGIVIQGAFYVLLKVLLGLGVPGRAAGALLMGGAVLNMALGNMLALVQTNTKRLLAYSTVAYMGYVMLSLGIGLRYGLPEAVQAGMFLMLAHAAMKGLAFLCKGVCHFYLGATTIAQLRGVSRQLPLVAVTLSLALGGLAGIPPLAGFTAKWYVLSWGLRAVRVAAARGEGIVVPIALCLFLLNGLLALGYYLPLIGTLFAPSPTAERADARPWPWMTLPLLALGGLVLAMGVYPGPWFGWMGDTAAYLLGLEGPWSDF
jgi:proton-translocating NADH-quinone oxidoreductase chain N